MNYISLNDGKSHLIDFDLFSIILPTDFKYKRIDGIDSFVGEIKNGKSKFIFDYGWYSPKPPLDEKTYIEESRKGMDFETTQKFFNQIDLKPYEDANGGVNPREIIKKIKNLTLHKMTDSIAFHNNFKNNCEYYYTFEYEEAEFKVPHKSGKCFDKLHHSSYRKSLRHTRLFVGLVAPPHSEESHNLYILLPIYFLFYT